MSDLARDLRFAARTLGRTPAWTLATILVLSLGIGATTAMFGVVDALFLRPLPFRDPERVVIVQQREPQSAAPQWLSAGDFHAYRDRATSFEALSGFTGGRLTLLAGGEPEQVTGLRVSPTYFRVLDGKPLLGRVFADGDRAADAPVVLSYALWQRRFGGDASIVGRTIDLSGQPYRVIGVMSRGYADGNFVDLWRLDDFPIKEEERGLRTIGGIGRLRPGVSVAQANAELGGISRQLADEHPGTNAHVTAIVAEYHAFYVAFARPAVLMLLGAVALVLLVACANVAGLMLARGSTRRGEMAIRAALGATRGRIARQLLTESVLLAVLGGALGLLFAGWGVDLILGGLSPNNAYTDDVHIDLRTAAFTLGCSLAAAIGAGLWPALEASRWDVRGALDEGGTRATAGRRATVARSALVTVEIALAFALLSGAGVLGKSFAGLVHAPRGFDPRHVYVFETQLPEARYPDDERRAAFTEAVLARLGATPGVEAAAAASAAPLLGGWGGSFEIEGRPPWPRGGEPEISIQVASPGYLRTFGVALREGRFFTDGDRAGAPRVAVVNETFAKRFFPGERAVGKRIRVDWGSKGHLEPTYREIVGVYGDTRNRGLERDPIPEALFPIAEHPNERPTIAVRARSEAEARAAVRGAVREVDPVQPVIMGRRWFRGVAHVSFEELVDLTIGVPRFHAALLGVFAAIALVLTLIGVSGLVAYSVQQRTREFAVRLAFGARPRHIVRLVLARLAWLVAAGLALGLALAAAAARVVRSLAYGVSPLDPALLAGAAILLTATALVAGYLPARRAARVSPMVALRGE